MTKTALRMTQPGIPRSLAPFFQEYDLEALDPDRARFTVIERTLRYGDRAELGWLFSRYPEAVITEWVARWGQSSLPPAHLAFWRLLLNLENLA